MNETAIVFYDQLQDPIAAITKMGDWIAKSGMFGCTKVEQGYIMATVCATERMSFLKFKQTYHITHDGNIAMRSDVMLAKLRERGGKYKILARTPDKAAIEVDFDGDKQPFSYTWEEAKQERYVYQKDGKTLKDNYATPRQRMKMLWLRVASDAVGAMCPEVISGIIVDDGIEAEAPALNMAAPAAEPVEKIITPKEFQTPATPKPASAVVVDLPAEKVEAKQEPKPEVQQVAAPAGELSIETQQKLNDIMAAGDAKKAHAWLLAKGHLKDGQHLGHLAAAMANQIITRTASFWAAVNK